MTALRQGRGVFVFKIFLADGAFEIFLEMNPLDIPAVVITRRAVRIFVIVPVHETVIGERGVFPLPGFQFGHKVPPCGQLFVVIQLYHIEGLYIYFSGGFYE
jgi:hypothetical protein